MKSDAGNVGKKRQSFDEKHLGNSEELTATEVLFVGYSSTIIYQSTIWKRIVRASNK